MDDCYMGKNETKAVYLEAECNSVRYLHPIAETVFSSGKEGDDTRHYVITLSFVSPLPSNEIDDIYVKGSDGVIKKVMICVFRAGINR